MRVARAFRLPVIAAMTALALSGCMRRNAPVAVAPQPTLDSLAYGRDTTSGAFVVATLKRALTHLHAAQAALEKVTLKKLLAAETTASTRAELFSVREEILRLMREFRGKGDL